jgi:hypothetical protein
MLTAVASLTLATAVTLAAPAPDKVAAELVMGSAIIDRQPQPLPEKLFAGQILYAFTTITGPGGGYVEHVWSCNGKEVARHYLPVGQSKRWRTWSRHKVAAGQYHVEILAADGTRLQQTDFVVAGS